MKQHSKLSSEQKQQASEQQTQQSQTARDFASAEELLRYDAEQTTVPPGISQRLQKSIGPLSPPARSWWRRMLGGK